MLRGMLGSVKSENPKGEGEIGEWGGHGKQKIKLNLKIKKFKLNLTKLIRLGIVIINLPF